MDWSSVGWAFIGSATAFVVLPQSNFLVLMTTWYFCKVPNYLGDFQLGSVIMGLRTSVSSLVQIRWWYCLARGFLACWRPIRSLFLAPWNLRSSDLVVTGLHGHLSWLALWIGLSLWGHLVSSLGSTCCSLSLQHLVSILLIIFQSHFSDDRLLSYISLLPSPSSPPFFFPLLLNSTLWDFQDMLYWLGSQLWNVLHLSKLALILLQTSEEDTRKG